MTANGSHGSVRIGDLPLFAGLTPVQLERIAALLHSRSFPAGVDIMTAEQPGEAVYIVLQGTLKIHAEQTGGKDVVLALLGPGHTVGEMAVVEGTGRSASVFTLEESRLVWMDRASFLQILHDMPAVSLNLVRILSRRLRAANELIASLVNLDVNGRVARQILALAEEYGEPSDDGSQTYVPLSLTQAALADIIGASRVRVNQVLVDYRHRGYIAVDEAHHVTVRDEAALRRRVHQGV